MFKWYRDWQKKQFQAWQLELETEKQAVKEAGLPQFQRVISDEAEKHRESDEPWVTVVGERITENGLQIQLDWNDAFVKYLKAQNVGGKDDTQIVQHWLALIARQTADKLGENYQELEGKSSEFV